MIYHFAIYEAETGKVLRVGKSTNRRQRVLERRNLKPGEAIYNGEIDPRAQYLPGGVPADKPEETPVITRKQVGEHMSRILSYSDGYVMRRADTGEAIPADVQAYRTAVREAAKALKAMEPIPADYRDQKYWPVSP